MGRFVKKETYYFSLKSSSSEQGGGPCGSVPFTKDSLLHDHCLNAFSVIPQIARVELLYNLPPHNLCLLVRAAINNLTVKKLLFFTQTRFFSLKTLSLSLYLFTQFYKLLIVKIWQLVLGPCGSHLDDTQHSIILSFTSLYVENKSIMLSIMIMSIKNVTQLLSCFHMPTYLTFYE